MLAEPPPAQSLDEDMGGAISFEELRDGLARITSPPVRISFDDWEHMTQGFTVAGSDGEEVLELEGFQRLLRQVWERAAWFEAERAPGGWARLCEGPTLPTAPGIPHYPQSPGTPQQSRDIGHDLHARARARVNVAILQIHFC